MKPYYEWSPTLHDTKGLAMRNVDHAQSDWLVAPCMLTRDSGPLEESNWIAQQGILEDKKCPDDTWEVLEFNHWACGWFRILLVKPLSAAHAECEAIQDGLEQYPVLDEELMAHIEAESGGSDE